MFNMGKIRTETPFEPQEKPGYSMIAHYRNDEYVKLRDARWLDGIGNWSDGRMANSSAPPPENIAAMPLEDFARRESFDSWDFDKIWTFSEARESATGKIHPIPRSLPHFR